MVALLNLDVEDSLVGYKDSGRESIDDVVKCIPAAMRHHRTNSQLQSFACAAICGLSAALMLKVKSKRRLQEESFAA